VEGQGGVAGHCEFVTQIRGKNEKSVSDLREPPNEGPEGKRVNEATPIDELLARIRCGDRSAAAMFVLRYGDRIRRRLGGRLGPQMRRVFDSEDILSTVLRRLDVYLMDHDLLATNDNQLMSLIYRIADSAVVDKVRLSVKLRDLFGAEGGAADSAASQDGGLDDDAQMGVIFDAIDDPQDRVMVWMLLTDRSFEQIGQALDVPSATLRKRWQRLRERLSSKLTERAA